MTGLLSRLARFARSLYARLALVYLAGLLLLSLATAWIAVSQFNRLGREMQQRMQLDLAASLAQELRQPLRQGPTSNVAQQAARHIQAINPALSLYLLDHRGRLLADYSDPPCPTPTAVDPAAIRRLLSAQPMLPVLSPSPCSAAPGIFTAAPVRYGASGTPGYLFVSLGSSQRMSMLAMLRSSSITRALIAAGVLALLIAAAAGLLLFALLTRRFRNLTAAVQRLAAGDAGPRLAPGRDDEIGQLTRAFNDMAATIEAQLAALRESDRQRRELVAGLSHDFRTPLTSLRGYADQLRQATASQPQSAQAVQAILANTERLTRLARQLSDLARVDVAEHALQAAPFSLSELANDVAAKLKPLAEAAGVALEVRSQPATVRVFADLALIDRALGNLVENAINASDAAGRVSLSVSAAGTRARLCVADQGIGIARDEIALVSQRFYRTKAGRRRGEGSGLGLAIVAEICHRHGSRLTIDSAPGRGTRMAFELPLA